jgi:hypothetical protein
VSLISIALFVFLVIWLVLRITFSFSPTHFRVLKTGFLRYFALSLCFLDLRSSQLEFNCRTSSLHYFRTHFSNEKCWLSLVVREDDKFYKIFSWKGQGTQEKRFLELFKSLKMELKHIQRKYGCQLTTKLRSEILSKEEITFIRPFATQIRSFTEARTDNKAQNICIEDLPVISYDDFFNHFNQNKTRKLH